MTTFSDGWTMEEPGLYTHPEYGGICKEQDGWYVYRNKDEDSGYGPFPTLFEAKQYLYRNRGCGL